MPTFRNNKRREERVRATFRVDLGSVAGLTRDVSASGMFFETEPSYVVESPLRMAIHIDTPGGPITMNYLAKVIRVERRGNKVGVAVSIVESALGRPARIAVSPP